MSLLQLSGVTKDYKLGKTTVRALRGLDLEIRAGEVVAIMGPSGSGKSTLMHILGALDRPTKGSALIETADLGEMKERQLVTLRGKKIGFVFQTFNLIQTLSALQNVELPMIFQSLPKPERLRRARQLLETVGLGDRIKHKPNELSGGERQRVAIARALANDPEIILADEPTGNLDTESGAAILDLLKKLSTTEQKTVILVTHDPEAAEIADRVVRLRDGCVASAEGRREREGVSSKARHGTEGSSDDPSVVGSADDAGSVAAGENTQAPMVDSKTGSLEPHQPAEVVSSKARHDEEAARAASSSSDAEDVLRHGQSTKVEPTENGSTSEPFSQGVASQGGDAHA